MKLSYWKCLLNCALLLTSSGICNERVTGADIFPPRQDDVQNYLATLAFTGPRICDSRPGHDYDPRYMARMEYGLLLARWTGERRLYHGTAHGNFKGSELRTPSFFGTRRFYPEIHTIGHFNFPKSLDESDFRSEIPKGLDPKLYPFLLTKTKGQPDIVYGYEFWPQELLKTISTLTARPKGLKTTLDLEKSKRSGQGDANKKVPLNVASARVNAKFLSRILGIPIRGTVTRRQFPFSQSMMLAKVFYYRSNSQAFAQTAENQILASVKMQQMRDKYFGKGKPYADLARFVDPEEKLAAQFGYDEAIIFSNQDLTFYKPLRISTKADAFPEVLRRWAAASYQAKTSTARLSYSPDYGAFIPFAKENVNGMGSNSEYLRSVARQLITLGRERRLVRKLHDHSANLLDRLSKDINTHVKGRSSNSKAIGKFKTLRKLVTKSQTDFLSAREVSEVRKQAQTLLQVVYCGRERDSKYCKMPYINAP